MTSIGMFLQNVPTGRDLYGTLDQTGTFDAAPAGSDAREKSFESLLSNLAQPAQDTAVASTATQGVSDATAVTAPAANSALAVGAQSRGTDYGADPANLVASLATAAALPSKSDARAADGVPQSKNAGEETAVSLPTPNATREMNAVTNLLGSLSQNSNAASASATHNWSAGDSFAPSTAAQAELAASPVQVASAFKAAPVGLKTAAGSDDALVAQGTAASSEAALVAQGTASLSKAALGQQAIAASSEAALGQRGTAPSSEGGFVKQETAAASEVPLVEQGIALSSEGGLVKQETAAASDALLVERGTVSFSKAALGQQATAAASEAHLVGRGTAAPSKAALVQQPTAPSKAAPGQQGTAPSKTDLIEQGTAAASDAALVDQGAAATDTPQTVFGQTAANWAQEAGNATTNSNQRAFAQASSPAQKSEVSTAVSSAPTSKPTQDSLDGSASAGNARRARNSAENGRGEDAATADASSVITPVAQSSGSAPPVIVTPSRINGGQADSPNSAATSTVSSSRTHPAGFGLSPTDSAAASTSNALDAAMTTASPEPASSSSFEMNITALSTATYFAPVARLSPVQQVSDAVAATIPSLFGLQNSSAASSVADLGNETGISDLAQADALAHAAQPSATSVKTLNLQLQPETLGQVTIKLNLSDSGLAVQLEAANQQTAELIDKDKQAFTQGLSDSGYSVASLVVSVAPQHASHFSGDTSSQQGQADPNTGRSGGQPSGHDGSPNGDRSSHAPSAFTEPPLGAQNLVSNDAVASVVGNTGRRDLFV
ncbi:MAG: flagellar hook-length control protein FliK [Beijerinckiaceae bacterium]